MIDQDVNPLRRFVEEDSDEAFRAFVAAHFDFVYRVALRHVHGDVHLARDAAQHVFIDVARKARLLACRPTLVGWLYTSTRFAATTMVRARTRRAHYEQTAHAMNERSNTPASSEIEWEELKPVIDDALAELRTADREAILLRHFENHSFARIGKTLGLTENAARMRVERAMDKLRRRLARAGITSTATALTATLAAQPLTAAPAGMATAVATDTLAVVATGKIGLFALLERLLFMNTVKIAVGLGLVAALGVGVLCGSRFVATDAEPQLAALRQRIAGQIAENVRLRDSLAQHPSGALTAAPPAAGSAKPLTRTDELQALAKFAENKWATVNTHIIDPKGWTLTSEFADAFDLQPEELRRLQGAIDRSRTKLADLERKRGQPSRDEKGDFVFTIPPLPAEGGALFDELRNEFAEVLGPQRYRALQILGERDLSTRFGQFGIGQRTYRFSYDPGAPLPFVLGDDVVIPESVARTGGPGSRTSNQAFQTFEDLAAHAGPIAQVAPIAYQQKKPGPGYSSATSVGAGEVAPP